MMVLVSPQPEIATSSPQGAWTVADWERLPRPEDGRRYEVVGGVLHMTTAPTNFHQWIVQRLVRLLGMPAEDAGVGVSFFAPIGVLLSPVDAVQPDFLLVLTQHMHIVRGGRIRGAPDLVIEVRSPGNSAAEMQQKQQRYAQNGVPEYVVIEPATRTLHHYRLEAGGVYGSLRTYAEGEHVTFDCLPAVPLSVTNLFTGAPDTTLSVEE
jgi:Uma2 family endonuclease